MSDTPDTIEGLRAELEKTRAELSEARELVSVLLDNNPDGVAIAKSFTEMRTNEASDRIFAHMSAPPQAPGEDWREAFGLFREDGVTPFPLDELALARSLMRGEEVIDDVMFLRSPAGPQGVWLSVSSKPLKGGGAIAVYRDISERRKLEADLARRNAELAARAEENARLIARLRVAVDELSTPVLELWDDVLALPVVGVVDTQRSAQMVERLLAEVVERRSRFVIVDLTGVEVIDTSTADRFLKMARAVKLLGGECVVTGIQPAVAQTLVELGVEFAGLDTQRNLKRALQVCMAKQRAMQVAAQAATAMSAALAGAAPAGAAPMLGATPVP